VLGGVGDAIGFRNGKWEFLKDGPRIHAQLGELGGISALTYAASPPVAPESQLLLPGQLTLRFGSRARTTTRVNRRDWRVSDDTVMHIATAEALVDDWERCVCGVLCVCVCVCHVCGVFSPHERIFLAAASMKDLEDKLARKYVACGKDMEGRGVFLAHAHNRTRTQT